MNLLSPDLMAKELSYLPFNDVISLCKTNSKYHNFCTDKHYELYWKNMIVNTYGPLSNYQELLKKYKNLEYNYILYTQLINLLDLDVQMDIYKHQGDEKSYERVRGIKHVTSKFRNISKLANRIRYLNNRQKLMFPNGTIISKKSVKYLLKSLINDIVKEDYLPKKDRDNIIDRMNKIILIDTLRNHIDNTLLVDQLINDIEHPPLKFDEVFKIPEEILEVPSFKIPEEMPVLPSF